MKGNISGMFSIGGIVGQSTAAIEDNINIMEGNITWSTITNCGGIGYTSMINPSIKRNILAMKGNCPGILCNTAPTPLTNVLNNIYSNKFGMTVISSIITTSNGTAWYYDTMTSLSTQLSGSTYITSFDNTKGIPLLTYGYTDHIVTSRS